jgi:hypothetical protein
MRVVSVSMVTCMWRGDGDHKKRKGKKENREETALARELITEYASMA